MYNSERVPGMDITPFGPKIASVMATLRLIKFGSYLEVPDDLEIPTEVLKNSDRLKEYVTNYLDHSVAHPLAYHLDHNLRTAAKALVFLKTYYPEIANKDPRNVDIVTYGSMVHDICKRNDNHAKMVPYVARHWLEEISNDDYVVEGSLSLASEHENFKSKRREMSLLEKLEDAARMLSESFGNGRKRINIDIDVRECLNSGDIHERSEGDRIIVASYESYGDKDIGELYREKWEIVRPEYFANLDSTVQKMVAEYKEAVESGTIKERYLQSKEAIRKKISDYKKMYFGEILQEIKNDLKLLPKSESA